MTTNNSTHSNLAEWVVNTTAAGVPKGSRHWPPPCGPVAQQCTNIHAPCPNFRSETVTATGQQMNDYY
jgi:hypothetical protein